MYATLKHGRSDPDADMEGWGTLGPTFKVEAVAFVYGKPRLLIDGQWVFMTMHEDMLYYDGSYYGDVYIDSSHAGAVAEYDDKKAEL